MMEIERLQCIQSFGFALSAAQNLQLLAGTMFSNLSKQATRNFSKLVNSSLGSGSGANAFQKLSRNCAQRAMKAPFAESNRPWLLFAATGSILSGSVFVLVPALPLFWCHVFCVGRNVQQKQQHQHQQSSNKSEDQTEEDGVTPKILVANSYEDRIVEMFNVDRILKK